MSGKPSAHSLTASRAADVQAPCRSEYHNKIPARTRANANNQKRTPRSSELATPSLNETREHLSCNWTVSVARCDPTQRARLRAAALAILLSKHRRHARSSENICACSWVGHTDTVTERSGKDENPSHSAIRATNREMLGKF